MCHNGTYFCKIRNGCAKNVKFSMEIVKNGAAEN